MTMWLLQLQSTFVNSCFNYFIRSISISLSIHVKMSIYVYIYIYIYIYTKFLVHKKNLLFYIYRSSHRGCSVRKGVLACLTYRCFPANFAKFPRSLFVQNTSGRLLLKVPSSMFDRILSTHILPTITRRCSI